MNSRSLGILLITLSTIGVLYGLTDAEAKANMAYVQRLPRTCVQYDGVGNIGDQVAEELVREGYSSLANMDRISNAIYGLGGEYQKGRYYGFGGKEIVRHYC